jgi:uncharacterized protein YkwD
VFLWYPGADQTGTHSIIFTATDAIGATGSGMVIFEVVARSGGATSDDPRVALISPVANATFDQGKDIPLEAAAAASPRNGSWRISVVQFYARPRTGGAAVKIGDDAAAPYQLNWRGAKPGAYDLFATASDDAGHSATSAFVPITVKEAPPEANRPPVVAITTPANGARFTPPATVAITATASDPDGTIAKVEFFAGATRLGEDAAAPYQFSWTNVANGTYALTAKATDNRGLAATSAAVTVTVGPAEGPGPGPGPGPGNQPPTAQITQPAQGATFQRPATIAIAATASDPDGTVARVEFFDGAVKLGEDATAPYAFSWTGAAAGTHALTVKATDNANAVGTSAPVTITVTNPGTPGAATVRIARPLANASITINQEFEIEAQVTGATGAGIKVDFYEGSNLIGTANGPYVVSGSIDTLGTYTLTAKLSNSAGLLATSAPVTITVINGAPSGDKSTLRLMSPSNGQSFTAGQSVTITALAQGRTAPPASVQQVEFFAKGASGQRTSLGVGSASGSSYTRQWTAVAGTTEISATATFTVDTPLTDAVAITVTGTTPDPCRQPPCDGGGGGSGDEYARVLELTNQERARNGVPALTAQAALAAAAQGHAVWMASTGNFSHTGEGGSSVAQRAQRAGYSSTYVGENIAMGYPTPEAVVQGWMDSPGHRANMLNRNYRHLGIGIKRDGGGRPYWVQNFGSTSIGGGALGVDGVEDERLRMPPGLVAPTLEPEFSVDE